MRHGARLAVQKTVVVLGVTKRTGANKRVAMLVRGSVTTGVAFRIASIHHGDQTRATGTRPRRSCAGLSGFDFFYESETRRSTLIRPAI